MVYYRRYRRTTRRGYARRRTLSSYSIATRTSAKSQSRQIYALRRRIARIQRLTKPEIKIAPLVSGGMRLSNGTVPSGYIRARVYLPVNLSNVVAASTTSPGTGVAVLGGRFARLQSIVLKGHLSYTADALIGGTGDNFPPEYADLQRGPAMMRIVIIQLKATRSNGLPAPSDVWSYTTSGSDQAEGSTYMTDIALLRAPLRLGVGRIAKVLSDKTYMLSDTCQAMNIKTKLKYLKSWYRSPTEDIAKGSVAMYVMMYSPDNLAADCDFDYVSKCAYTDA